MKASDYKCFCGKQAEEFYVYLFDDAVPYCKECFDRQVGMVEKIKKVYDRLKIKKSILK